MRTEDLIVALAADARPVRLLPATPVRFAWWAGSAVLAMAVAVLVFHPRPDLAEVFRTAPWLSESLAVVAMLALAAFAVQLSAVPGAGWTHAVRTLALVALAGWTVLVARRLGGEPAPLVELAREPVHLACLLRIVAVGVVPAAVAWRQLRRAAPLEPVWSGTLVVLASVSAGALVTAVVCPLGGAAHALSWHVGPVLGLVALAAAALAFRLRR